MHILEQCERQRPLKCGDEYHQHPYLHGRSRTRSISRAASAASRGLYGEPALERFRAAHVCVIGVGGVGSWIVEALARSAIGQLTLIDLDNVAESNINRQIQALSGTIGQAKIDALAERIAQINPFCKVNLVEDFIDAGQPRPDDRRARLRLRDRRHRQRQGRRPR